MNKIYIELKQSTYKAGEILEGQIHLKLGAKIPEDSSVIIEFKGVEKTKWMMKSPIIGDDSYLESNG